MQLSTRASTAISNEQSANCETQTKLKQLVVDETSYEAEKPGSERLQTLFHIVSETRSSKAYLAAILMDVFMCLRKVGFTAKIKWE